MVQISTKPLTLAFAYPAHQQPIFLQESEQLLPTPKFIADLKLSVAELFSWLKPGNV
ncbi:MAG: hypothetical protein AB1589_25325 [Cyanobacteriota bacterium]